MTRDLTRTEWFLFRHGKTPGNIKKRYIGRRTDEPLALSGIEALKKRWNGRIGKLGVQKAFASPMLRARQTAEILFPTLETICVDGLEEIDFGSFEGKNYQELESCPEYCEWVASGGAIPFPGGESRADFVARTWNAFRRIVLSNADAERIALVAHGGTLMAILSELTHEEYFAFQTSTGEGYALVLETNGDNIGLVSYCSLS